MCTDIDKRIEFPFAIHSHSQKSDYLHTVVFLKVHHRKNSVSNQCKILFHLLYAHSAFFQTRKVMNPFYVFFVKNAAVIFITFHVRDKSLVAIKFQCLISHIQFPANLHHRIHMYHFPFHKIITKNSRDFFVLPIDRQLQPHCIIDYRNRLKQSNYTT